MKFQISKNMVRSGVRKFVYHADRSTILKGNPVGLYMDGRGIDNYSVWGGGISSVSVMSGSPGDVSENL